MKSLGSLSICPNKWSQGAATIVCLALSLPAPTVVLAQQAEPAVVTTTTTTEETPKIPNDQLESLVSPIALYPDPLLSQTLVASTYPLEIIQLQQWLNKNGGLKDKALADAVAKQPWDPSIQSMAAFPDVVTKLSENIQWTSDLGNAFLAQQSDVMAAVQRLRAKAQGTGTLKTSEQQKVETQTVEGGKEVIVIQPSSPDVVYVPTYDPAVVYGVSSYPYPSLYYPGYIAGAGLAFGAGLALGAAWGGGWGYGCGWNNGDININNNNNFTRNSNRNSNVNRGQGGQGNWQHNPAHRGNAPYGNRQTADKFGGTARGDRAGGRQPGGGAGARPGGGVGSAGGVGNRPGSGAGARPGGGANARPGGGAGKRPSTRPANRGGGGANARPGGGAGKRPSTRPANRGGGGANSIGGRTPSRSGGGSAFGGGGGGMRGGSARAASNRGSRSMGGGRGGGGRGGGGRRR